MGVDRLTDLTRCAVHTMTHKPWSLRQCVDAYAQAGIGGISVWRNVIDPQQGGVNVQEGAAMIRDAGLAVPALVRGGFFVAADASARQNALDDNCRAIDEAATLGAEMVVLVVGAVPGLPLSEARKQVAQGIADVVEHAQSRGVKLAIEPLHPMYAADKSCVNRAAEARQICDDVGSAWVGIAFDVYHVWWDPDLSREIELAGQQNRLFGFHVCDWRVDTRHLLTDRGLMGEGCIDIRGIRAMVEAAGFNGFNEVEIFSQTYWDTDQHAYLQQIIQAYHEHV